MLENQKTLDKFGYSPHNLTKGSSKPIIFCCDYCGNYVERTYKIYLKYRSELEKDTCNESKCKFKKREEISLKKYGVKNSAQRRDVREKLTAIIIEDYHNDIMNLFDQGYSCSNIETKLSIPRESVARYLKGLGIDVNTDLQNKKEKTLEEKLGKDFKQIIQDKYKQTVAERYGCENTFQVAEFKDKIKETNLEKLGVEYPTQSLEVIAKTKKTNKEKYGYENVFQVDEFKEKSRETNLQKYGYKYATQSLEIQSKTKETNLDRYGFEYCTQNPEVKKKALETMIKNGNATFYQNLSAKEWADKTGYSLSRMHNLISMYGIEEASKMLKNDSLSSIEILFMNFLTENNIEYKQHTKISYDASFYVPDFKISNVLIEVDGLYWHSDANDRIYDKYHIDKANKYRELGYDSLFFREDELRDKFDIVKSITLNKLGKSNRIFARKCVIKEVDTKTSNKFFEDSHLMGRGKGRTFALFFNNEIVSAIRVKRLKNKEYEVSRFCHKLNTNVIGGFSKLLKYVESQLDMDQLLTFIDKRYGKGEYLADLGFEYVHTYPSFKWTNGINTYHRLKFPSTSGYDNGFFKIYDCGQAKFVKTFLKSSHKTSK